MKSVNLLALLALAFAISQVQATNWFTTEKSDVVEQKEDLEQTKAEAKEQIAEAKKDLEQAKEEAKSEQLGETDLGDIDADTSA